MSSPDGSGAQTPAEVDELAELVSYHQDRYYNGDAEISDAEFDSLWDRLRELAPDHPVVRRVGADRAGYFAKRRHLMPMGSQEKASGDDQFRQWAAKTGLSRFVVQFKLDGASIELQYRGGAFVAGVTRGDGEVGDDITANVVRMHGVPKTVPDSFTGSVRGEVIMTHEVHTRHYSDKANCRNAANGIMKRKDGVGAEYLHIRTYDVWSAHSDDRVALETTKVEWLRKAGFDVVETTVIDGVESVIEYRAKISDRRTALGYDIDGLVVKSDEVDERDMQRARPTRQIAFKFAAEEAVTVLREVEWSESGHLYTPVGHIDPVRLAGTTVRRASLVHPDLISQLGLRIGSEVVVTKRGDIIPKIERVFRQPSETHDIAIPTTCSTCGATLVNEGKRLYCPNTACPRRSFHRLQKWVTTLDIRDLGDALIERLFATGRVGEIADLYGLTADELAELEGMGRVSATKIVDRLRGQTDVPLARFVAGFDINGIGERKVEMAVDAGFNTLDALRSAGVEELAAVDGYARTTAQQLAEGLEAVREEMDRVLATGLVTIAPPRSDDDLPLVGNSFCFTGAMLTMKRSEAEELVRSLGGTTRSAPTKGLTYLVTNDADSGSSKARKARELGVEIIDEPAFRALAGLV